MTTPMTRAQRAASLCCPIDGAATWDGREVRHHVTIRDAAEYAVRYRARIVAVGNAVNREHGIAGLSVADEERAMAEARRTLGAWTGP